jgi:PKD repeat protein
MSDSEGSAFVRTVAAHPNLGGTDSLWLADDNSRSVWEIDPYTGGVKSRIAAADWAATGQFSAATGTGTGPLAVTANFDDIESIAYDAAADILYVFSGTCCTSSVQSTAFRLTRQFDGSFRPESWQPLADYDFTGAAWNPAEGLVYVGVNSVIRSFDYVANTVSPTFSIPGVSGILGMGFSDTGADLFVTTSSIRLFRVTWATKTVLPGWSFDLSSFGVLDSRAVELINDEFYVNDGYDGRSSNDPLDHAVFVFGVCCDSQAPPTASFSWSQVASPASTVQFTDTSSGSPTGWSWDFGDGTGSSAQNPSRTYAAAGEYTVTLTASNGNGDSDPVSQVVTVSVTSQSVFAATADTYSDQKRPTTNYGTTANLHVKSSSSNEKRGYVKFVVSGSAGRTVTSAKLLLTVTDPSVNGGTAWVVSSSWSESGAGGLVWDNQPALPASPLSSIGAVTVGQVVEFDVTAAIGGDNTYSFAITSASGDTVYYATRESANPPELVITYG